MKLPSNIFENPKVVEFLEKRNLIKQYKKAKDVILIWNVWWLDLKERKSKKSWIYSFRINKQFRAIWFFDNDWDFIVSKIDNHQNS